MNYLINNIISVTIVLTQSAEQMSYFMPTQKTWYSNDVNEFLRSCFQVDTADYLYWGEGQGSDTLGMTGDEY